MTRTIFILAAIVPLLWGCVAEEGVEHAEDFGLRHADDFLHDAQWRRAELEASLWKPELPYARKRLAGYGFGDRGWDQLPLINTTVTTIGDSPRTFEVLPDDPPTSRSEWLELGERVFWSMPMRRDTYLEWLVERPEIWDEVGLKRDDEGNIRGIVRFTDARGNERVGATCGLCHGAGGLAGQATRVLDLGLARHRYAEAYKQDSVFDTWGRGRVDVTDDAVVDALAIPDLWGVRHQAYMNQSGAIKLDTPAALAIRFDTQYIVGHSLEARADRSIGWALMMFVYSLEPPAPSAAPHQAGERVFEARCASCHDPRRGYSGGLVDASMLSSDPQAAHSVLRGTGAYKVPSLVRVSHGAPYLHDGSIATLRELVGVHPTASDLTPQEVDDLITFLQTL